MRKLSLLLMIAGIFIIGFAVYQIIDTNISQKQGTVEAKNLLGYDTEAELNTNNGASEKRTYSKKHEFNPQKGDVTGLLKIDKIGAELPIFEGTDEDELSKGIGHYAGTAYSEEDDQIVLSGHRETVFRKMGELEIGDIMTLELPYGDFDYEIVETYVTDADDRTVIVPHDEEVLTVTTCYPFTYVGSAPDRYIVNAVPVDKTN